MNAVEYILDGLEAELALERELGVRAVEFDRSLLAEPVPTPAKGPVPSSKGPVPTPAKGPVPTPVGPVPSSKGPVPTPARGPVPGSVAAGEVLDYVFLHDKPFSPGAAEMVAKIAAALGKTAETAPAVFDPPLPAARAYVILGFAALRKWAPSRKAEPGQWTTLPGGEQALVTYSPEWFLRFGAATPALKAKKLEMWNALKALQRRIAK